MNFELPPKKFVRTQQADLIEYNVSTVAHAIAFLVWQATNTQGPLYHAVAKRLHVLGSPECLDGAYFELEMPDGKTLLVQVTERALPHGDDE